MNIEFAWYAFYWFLYMIQTYIDSIILSTPLWYSFNVVTARSGKPSEYIVSKMETTMCEIPSNFLNVSMTFGIVIIWWGRVKRVAYHVFWDAIGFSWFNSTFSFALFISSLIHSTLVFLPFLVKRDILNPYAD